MVLRKGKPIQIGYLRSNFPPAEKNVVLDRARQFKWHKAGIKGGAIEPFGLWEIDLLPGPHSHESSQVMIFT